MALIPPVSKLATLAGRTERCYQEARAIVEEIEAAQRAEHLPCTGRSAIHLGEVQFAAARLNRAQAELWTIVKAARRAAKQEG